MSAETTLPYVRHSETSKAAAESMEVHAGSLEAMVLTFIQVCGDEGATDYELEEALKLSHQTASARRRTLVLKGKVRDSGTTRRTRSGRSATVWITGSGELQLGTSLSKKPPTPTPSELRIALDCIRDSNPGMVHPALSKTYDWLKYLASQGEGK